MVRATQFGMKLASHYLPVEEILVLAERVEALGYDSVWATEGRMSPDAVTTTAAIAARTNRVRIGTSVLNPFSRTPGLLAISAASIDRISAGRFVLGLGAGDPDGLEKQQIPYDRPLTRLAECVEVLRRLWDGERVSYRGQVLRIAGLELDFRPRQEQIPVYLAATGPKALRLAGRLGDAVLLNTCVAGTAAEAAVATARQAGAAKMVANVVVGMHDDVETAVRGTKPHIATYLLRFPALARVIGVPEPILQAVRKAGAYSLTDACAALPDRYVHQLAAVGTPADCRDWIREYTAGMDEALLTPAFGDMARIVEELAPGRL